ncbi:Transcriptional adapter ada2 [Allomyces arbusculus]|nr:Transcriptional adapter ada2 [Allomyces arbusculus]
MTVTHRKYVGVRYHCDACRKDVSDIGRITCAECDDFDLCVECFAAGVEVATHKNDHAYRVMDTLTFPVFDENWGAEEEILMMEGLEKYGMGNWADVADHVGTKTMADVEEHYYSVFVNSPQWPLPDLTRTFSPPSTPRRRPAPIPPPAPVPENKKAKPLTSQPCNHEIAGFMPGRGEFEAENTTEPDEICVKELTFEETDTPEETAFKLAIMDIYNAKLDRKYERKKLILDRNLQEHKKMLAQERKKTKEERELYNQMKVFGRMQTAQDFMDLMEGLQIEAMLKEKIERLQEYRRNGVRTFHEAQEYEKERAKRYNITRPTPPALPPPPPIAQFIPRYPRAVPVAATTAVPTADGAPASTSRSLSRGATPDVDRPVGRRPAQPIDISTAEGLHLLSDREQELCSTLRILPKSYLNIKDTLLGEYVSTGHLGRRRARDLIKIDVNKTSLIFNFFVEMGWIKSASSRKRKRERGGEDAEERGTARPPPAASSSASASVPARVDGMDVDEGPSLVAVD